MRSLSQKHQESRWLCHIKGTNAVADSYSREGLRIEEEGCEVFVMTEKGAVMQL
jgi:hypothetical protein